MDAKDKDILEIEYRSPTRDYFQFVQSIVGSDAIDQFSEDADPIEILAASLKKLDNKSLLLVAKKSNVFIELLKDKKNKFLNLKSKNCKDNIDRINNSINSLENLKSLTSESICLEIPVDIDEYSIGLFIESHIKNDYSRHDIILENLRKDKSFYSNLYLDSKDKNINKTHGIQKRNHQ